MTLSDTSIKNPVFAWMLMIGLITFGWIGFHRMGISQLPDVDFPVVTVTVTWENAAPEIMETQVADIIEDSVTSVEGIRTITSTSQLGQTTITIEFNLNRSIDAAVQDVQSHIAQAQRNLPEGQSRRPADYVAGAHDQTGIHGHLTGPLPLYQ
jgi:multidrug efflux pump subunit AcrB